MKLKIEVLLIAVGMIFSTGAHAALIATCSSPICSDGTSCSTSGSRYANCACIYTYDPLTGFVNGSTASCSSGVVVSTAGNPQNNALLNVFPDIKSPSTGTSMIQSSGEVTYSGQ